MFCSEVSEVGNNRTLKEIQILFCKEASPEGVDFGTIGDNPAY